MRSRGIDQKGKEEARSGEAATGTSEEARSGEAATGTMDAVNLRLD